MSILAEKNKDVIRKLMAEVDRGNIDVVDACYSPDYTDRTPSPGRSLAPGREGVRQAFALFQRAFPDTRHTIEDVERWAEHGLGVLDQLGISLPGASAESTRMEKTR